MMCGLRALNVAAKCVVGAAVLAACSSDSQDPPTVAAPQSEPATAVTAPAIPDVITAARGGFVPESFDFDQTNRRFLTGSFADGSVYEIGVDGTLKPFVTDTGLVSSVGIEVDEPRERLLVANSNASVFGMPLGDPGGPALAQLGIYDLSTGERLAMVDLAAQFDSDADAAFFVNDVAVADDGTAFVTDTVRNVVYRVDADYNASVHYSFDVIEGLALNGIAWHPAGFLIVGDVGTGRLFRLPTASGAVAREVVLPEALAGADGMAWRGDGALAVVQNSPSDGRVVALASDDSWASAHIVEVATHAGQATAPAIVGDEIYVIQPHFADADPPTIQRVDF